MEENINKYAWKGIIRRQKKAFLITLLFVILIFTTIAFYLPPIYRSEAKILIENQEIPEEYVRSTITTYVNERLQILTQQIMNSEKLSKIINEFNLYNDLTSMQEKIQSMRDDIELTTIEENIVDRRSTRNIRLTVAFTLSYQGKDPEIVQQVADVLANLYISEDASSREKNAGTTIVFFEKELERVKKDVKDYEDKISNFKSENIDQLPGSSSAYIQNIARLEQEVDRIDTIIRTLKEKMIYLESQIVTVNPLLPIVGDEGKMASNPQERLKYLQLKLIRLQANLSDKHPDVKALKSEIEDLEGRVGETDITSEKLKSLNQIKSKIAELKGKVGENHPDVVKLNKEAEILSHELNRMQTNSKMRQLSEEKPDNPAYMNLKAQIIAANTEINSLNIERGNKENELEILRKKIQMAPMVEQEFNQLMLDYASTKNKYNEVLNKLYEARLSKEMDVSEQGAQFAIADPPGVSNRPYKPNRLAIILLGVVLGFGIGLGLVSLRERLDNSIKTSDEVERITGIPVIASVSEYKSEKSIRLRRKKKIIWATSTAIIILCGTIAVNRYVLPLDDLWQTFESRLIEMGIPLNRPSGK